MNIASTSPRDTLERGYAPAASYLDTSRSSASAISWGAIIAGAAAAAALSLLLLFLGVGLGLSSVSPWSHEGISSANFGRSTIVWLALTQLLASGLGGYLAGRLRIKWIDTKRDEVYFRDTAHGFLAWALATLVTAALLTSVTGAILDRGLQAGSTMVGGAASNATLAVGGIGASATEEADNGPWTYFVDALFRSDRTTVESTSTAPEMTDDTSDRTAAEDVAEVGRIFMNFSRSGPLPREDVRYAAQLVAQRTGMSQQDAEKRVADVYARAQTRLKIAEAAAREAADAARKASAHAALWMFLSLLIGAFVASVSAICGGRQRDA